VVGEGGIRNFFSLASMHFIKKLLTCSFLIKWGLSMTVVKKAKAKKIQAKAVKTAKTVAPVVGIIMGSQSDWATMEHAANVLESFDIPYETLIVSAHRTPKRLFDYATSAAGRGLKIIIAGAGGAAHLPGMTASMTALPVLGVPVKSSSMDGLDSLLSIAQMPAGVPVGTLAIGTAGAVNAGLLAVSILGLENPALAEAYAEWRDLQTTSVALYPDKTPSPKKAKAKK
jgi:5-(carboxyamino)imidazole ribonucleotide mutase